MTALDRRGPDTTSDPPGELDAVRELIAGSALRESERRFMSAMASSTVRGGASRSSTTLTGSRWSAGS